MKKYILLVFVAVIVTAGFTCLFFSGCGSNSGGSKDLTGLKFISTFENGNLYQTNTTADSSQFYVLQLRGSFQEMGRQYGSLLKDQLTDLYGETLVILSQKGISSATIETIANLNYDDQSSEMKLVIEGIAETSGLSLESVKILASMPIYMFYECSAISAWGDYAKDGTLCFGRNWDMFTGLFSPFAKYMTIVVYNPTGYSQSIADINFCGTFFPQTCMNSKGLMIEFNNGAMSSSTTDPAGEKPVFLFIPWLLNSASLEGLITSMEAITPNAAGIINIADSQQAYSYEMTTTLSLLRAAPQEGFIAASNDFADPRWTNLPYVVSGEASWFTKERRANLYQFGALNKGQIDATKIKEILDTTISDGGPTFPASGAELETCYQVVFTPSSKQLWFKFRGYSGWEFIDLSELFDNH